jgi:hypothetical protein
MVETHRFAMLLTMRFKEVRAHKPALYQRHGRTCCGHPRLAFFLKYPKKKMAGSSRP